MANGKKKAEKVSIKITHGELFDRVAILAVKQCEVTDNEKLAQVTHESVELTKSARIGSEDAQPPDIRDLIEELTLIHKQLWDVENEIRGYEAQKDFGPFFIRAARRVYKLNDKRSEIKSQIDKAYGHAPEVKEYTSYGQEEKDDRPPAA